MIGVHHTRKMLAPVKGRRDERHQEAKDGGRLMLVELQERHLWVEQQFRLGK